LIESEDEAGESWTTIGVSPNIIDALVSTGRDGIGDLQAGEVRRPGVKVLVIIASEAKHTIGPKTSMIASLRSATTGIEQGLP